jgi:hypothetical protein
LAENINLDYELYYYNTADPRKRLCTRYERMKLVKIE